MEEIIEKYKILIIDDEADIVDLIADIVSTQPTLEAVKCSSPQKALKLIEEVKFDLILSDFRMPMIDGGELAERIRSGNLNKTTSILFITANPEQTREFVERFEEILILPKPVTIASLAKKIIETLLKD